MSGRVTGLTLVTLPLLLRMSESAETTFDANYVNAKSGQRGLANGHLRNRADLDMV